ncbi:MAG: hypothetical protein WCH76_03750 [Candidatus Riflemargulisbacteria bacterium]
MSDVMKEMIIPYQGDINLEESIRLKLAETLSFSPEHFCFSYKKQGVQAIVQYNTDPKESIRILSQRRIDSRNIKVLYILVILGVFGILNFIVLRIKDSRVTHDLVNRQLVVNNQYHLRQELAIAREVKKTNTDVLEKINIFLQQPLQINSIYIDQHTVALSAYISKSDLQEFSNYLSEKGMLSATNFKDMGELVWVSIKSS